MDSIDRKEVKDKLNLVLKDLLSVDFQLNKKLTMNVDLAKDSLRKAVKRVQESIMVLSVKQLNLFENEKS